MGRLTFPYTFPALISVVFLGLLVYSNTFHAPFHFDDTSSIAVNPSIGDVWNLKAIWEYWPTRFLTYFSFALNHYFHGLDVFGYHLVNLSIHLSAGCAVFGFVRLLFETPALQNSPLKNEGSRIALFSALVFTAHPLQTQAVTYIVQRSTSMAALFYILCLFFYIRSRVQETRGTDPNLNFITSFIFGVFAMFSKEIAVSLPIAILLCEGFFFSGARRFFSPRILFLVLSLAVVVPLTMLLMNDIDFVRMNRRVEEFPPVAQPHYFFTELRVLFTYFRLFFLPVFQNLDYDYPILTRFSDPRVFLSFIGLAGTFFAGIKLTRHHRLLAFGFFWILLALAPESTVVPIADVLFEHRLYLPMLGFALFLSVSVFTLFRGRPVQYPVILLIALIGVYSALSYQRNLVWRDEVSLWSDVIRKSPGKVRGYNNRGNAYHQRKLLEQALSDFDRVLAIDPNSAQAYNNRSTVYSDMGLTDKAILGLSKAIQMKPDYAPAYNNRANAFCSKGLYDLALLDYAKCIELKPKSAQAYNNRGNAYFYTGELDKAIHDFTEAIRLRSNFAEAYIGRGNAYNAKKLYDESIADYSIAIKLSPDLAGAYHNRAVAYLIREDYGASLEDLDTALRLDDRYANAYINRARVYFRMGRYDRSWSDIRSAKALGVEPESDFLEQLTAASGPAA